MLAAFDVTLLTIFVLCSTQLLRPKGEKGGRSRSRLADLQPSLQDSIQALQYLPRTRVLG